MQVQKYPDALQPWLSAVRTLVVAEAKWRATRPDGRVTCVTAAPLASAGSLRAKMVTNICIDCALAVTRHSCTHPLTHPLTTLAYRASLQGTEGHGTRLRRGYSVLFFDPKETIA